MALERFWWGPSLDLLQDSRNLTQWGALAGTLGPHLLNLMIF